MLWQHPDMWSHLVQWFGSIDGLGWNTVYGTSCGKQYLTFRHTIHHKARDVRRCFLVHLVNLLRCQHLKQTMVSFISTISFTRELLFNSSHWEVQGLNLSSSLLPYVSYYYLTCISSVSLHVQVSQDPGLLAGFKQKKNPPSPVSPFQEGIPVVCIFQKRENVLVRPATGKGLPLHTN